MNRQSNSDHGHSFPNRTVFHNSLESSKGLCAEIDSNKLDKKLGADFVEEPACESDILDISDGPVIKIPFLLAPGSAIRRRDVMDCSKICSRISSGNSDKFW